MPESAGDLYSRAVVWDQHACLPLIPDTDFDLVSRHASAGATFVSLNVGYAPQDLAASMTVLSGFRNRVLAHPDRYVLARHVQDVRDAKATGRLAVAFDLEDARPLGGRIELVQTITTWASAPCS